ncbi:MAG: NAD(+)/NADH kinase [Clostridia bacterium]|nr:NAD(+)/NADH kinase [Clostridia bacterium]
MNPSTRGKGGIATNKAGIVVQRTKPEATRIAAKVEEWMNRSGIDTVTDSGWEGPLPDGIDCVIVLGGDGTLLSVARRAADRRIPILGVNMGNLGFLTEVEPDSIEPALEALVSGDYRVEERMMVEATVMRAGRDIARFTGLNDIVISKGAFSRMVKLDIYVNDEFFVTFPADGVIVSSPTGSTAYSLSAGGPLINPSIDVLLVTPICPHTLFSRSLVIAATDQVRVVVEPTHDEVAVTVDGQVGFRLESEDEIVVGRAPEVTRFIRTRAKNFYGILRERLKQDRL